MVHIIMAVQISCATDSKSPAIEKIMNILTYICVPSNTSVDNTLEEFRGFFMSHTG
jgi:hypothetical protein